MRDTAVKVCEAEVQASQWQARCAGVRSLHRAALGWLSCVAADIVEPFPAPSENVFKAICRNFPGAGHLTHDFPQLGCLLTPETWLHLSFSSLKISLPAQVMTCLRLTKDSALGMRHEH